jgi:hypothetical protein
MNASVIQDEELPKLMVFQGKQDYLGFNIRDRLSYPPTFFTISVGRQHGNGFA